MANLEFSPMPRGRDWSRFKSEGAVAVFTWKKIILMICGSQDFPSKPNALHALPMVSVASLHKMTPTH